MYTEKVKKRVITMKKNRGILLLFIVGLIIMTYPHIAQYVNNLIHQSQVQQFKNETEIMEAYKISEKIDSTRKCNEAIYTNEGSIYDPFTEAYNRNTFEECKAAPLNGEHIASIEIPKLNLQIPIYLGASENELSKGVGQVEGSSLPLGGANTHTVLAGHRGMGTKAMFRNLDQLQPGDVFYIYTLEKKLEYTVNGVDVILPHETDSLIISEGKDLASLITCHPYRDNSHRLVIHGERLPKK